MTTVIPMTVEPTAVDGLLVITMKQVTDDRGTVREFYRQSSWREAGLPDLGPWQQVNLTESKPGALRGLHGEAMHKLVAIAAGEAFGAYVDARPDSPSYGAVATVRLVPGQQVLVPQGVCNGFQSIGETPTQYLYCFDSEWVPGMAGVAVNPLDPELGISWPVPIDVDDPAQISVKDATAPALAG
ncbi:MAG: dTDP-4-dehydrorhamnose 3,5-epimerase [Actinomycetota bacterium]|jgi:dTDP-4-dehydrorhamnose 3,5-epimerase|nr:dTDP-4-dehydrorhamnose 3,5-epimerase [Actinomycetota bacterium]